MNEVVFKTLKEKNFIVKNYLFKVATELNLSLEETLLLIYLDNQEEPVLNLKSIETQMYLKEEQILGAFNRLSALGLIEVSMKKNEDGKYVEIISLDNLIKQVTSDKTKTYKKKQETDIFQKFEQEFVRTLAPTEYEMINDWLDKGIPEELILEALKEAVYNDARNLKYIGRILYEWQLKGYKSVEDIHNNLKKESNETTLVIPDYDWLHDGY